MKLQDAFDQYLRLEWRGTRGEETATINGQAALDFFGGTSSLTSIKTPLIDRYVLRLADTGNKPATINRKLAALSKILRFGHRRGELATMPYIPYQREPKGRLRWLTEQEERDVLNAFRARLWEPHAVVTEMLIDTGLRPSELWRLTSKDYKAGALFITGTKNGVTRIIPLTRRCTLHVEKRLCENMSDRKLFPYDNAWMNYGWNIVKRSIGLGADTEFVVYALRHTCASRLLQRNIALHVVQGWLGHTNPQQTMRYAHLSLANYQQAMKVLEAP
jgi:integrase